MNAPYVVIPFADAKTILPVHSTVGKGKRAAGNYNGQSFTYRAGRVRRLIEAKSCVCCGKVANHVRIVPTAQGSHTIDVGNLDENGVFTRFTVDHILLDCMGGAYSDDNLQIMCSDCNTAKGDVMTIDEINLVRKNPTKYTVSGIDIPYLMYVLDMQEMELRMREDGTPRRDLNRFRIQLSAERQKVLAKRALPATFVNPYADILRPPVVTVRSFAVWWKSMPSIKELVNNWLFRHNIIFC